MIPELLEAAQIATNYGTASNDGRNFLLGAMVIREDGTKAIARNGAVISSTFENYRIISDAHAECKALKFRCQNAPIIYVSRVLKKDGSLAMARPCTKCRHRIRSKNVKKVVYSIDNEHYGIFYPNVAEEFGDRIVEV